MIFRSKVEHFSSNRPLTEFKHLTMLKRLSVCNQHNKNCAEPRISVCNQHNKNCAKQTLARDFLQTLNRGYPHGINSSALTDFQLINSGLNKHSWLLLLFFLRFPILIPAFPVEPANLKDLHLQTSINFSTHLHRCIVHISFCKNQSFLQ